MLTELHSINSLDSRFSRCKEDPNVKRLREDPQGGVPPTTQVAVESTRSKCKQTILRGCGRDNGEGRGNEGKRDEKKGRGEQDFQKHAFKSNKSQVTLIQKTIYSKPPATAKGASFHGLQVLGGFVAHKENTRKGSTTDVSIYESVAWRGTPDGALYQAGRAS